MCGKMGTNEIDTMKNMMAMSVYFIIADTFDIDAINIEPENNLEKDLHMTSETKQELNDMVIDMFDGRQLDFSTIHNVQDIVDQIATIH
jgi:acyl carrier protein